MSVIELYDPAIPLTRSKLKKLKRKGLLPDYALPQISPSYQLKNIRPKTINQNWIFKEYAAGKNLMVHGYPGTGKTFLALYLALNDFNYSKVIIIRSVVPSRDRLLARHRRRKSRDL
jgi:phosphate starvation-inducible protein PhoH